MTQSSRRTFLKASTTTAVGAGLLGAASSKLFAGVDDTVRVGLVGCGGRGTDATMQALSSDSGKVKLVAMGDVFRDELDRSLNGISAQTANIETAEVDVPEERKFIGFDAYEKVLASDIDLVILATPPGFRPIHFEAAVNAGKHVFMEKPVATDAPGVRRVLEAAQKAKEKNLKVGVGLQRRHQQCYLEYIDRLQQGDVGEVLAMRVYWNSGGVWEPKRTREQVRTEMEYQMRNWYYYNWLCGDHIVEQHIHNLDVGCWIKGKYPVSAHGMGGREVRKDKRYGEIYDHHAVEYTFDDGSVMISQCRHIGNTWGSVDEWAHCTGGIVHLTNNHRQCSIARTDGTIERYSGENENPYQVEHNELFRAIRENIDYNEAEYGAHSSMVAILGRMCTYSGKLLQWDEALNNGTNIMPEVYDWDADPPTLPNENGEYPIPVPGITNVLV